MMLINFVTKESCWAFIGVPTLESINAIVTRDLISLSEQEIIDCDDQGTHCQSGYTANAYKYITRNSGTNSDDNYLYRGVQEEWKTDKLSTLFAYLTSIDSWN